VGGRREGFFLEKKKNSSSSLTRKKRGRRIIAKTGWKRGFEKKEVKKGFQSIKTLGKTE